jgi:hypothetical protein
MSFDEEDLSGEEDVSSGPVTDLPPARRTFDEGEEVTRMTLIDDPAPMPVFVVRGGQRVVFVVHLLRWFFELRDGAPLGHQAASAAIRGGRAWFRTKAFRSYTAGCRLTREWVTALRKSEAFALWRQRGFQVDHIKTGDTHRPQVICLEKALEWADSDKAARTTKLERRRAQ